MKTAYNGQNMLGANASLTISGCNAGSWVDDYYAGYVTSIAQLIANNIERGVYAYNVGLYFSNLDADDDPNTVNVGNPSGLPMYMDPIGPPGHKPKAIPFTP